MFVFLWLMQCLMDENSNIKTIEVDGEEVYLKKGLFGRGYFVYNPVRTKEGKVNWFNLITGGDWWNLIQVSILVVTFCLVIYFFHLQIDEGIRVIEIAKEICPSAFKVDYVDSVNNLRLNPLNSSFTNLTIR